jgi:hypothetical protein
MLAGILSDPSSSPVIVICLLLLLPTENPGAGSGLGGLVQHLVVVTQGMPQSLNEWIELSNASNVANEASSLNTEPEPTSSRKP